RGLRVGGVPAAALRAFAGLRRRDRRLRRRDSRAAPAAVFDRRGRAHGARLGRRGGVLPIEPAGRGAGVRGRGGASSMTRRVLHAVSEFLPRSETFVYTLVTGQQRFEASVLCHTRLHAAEFPFPRIHVVPKPLTKRAPAWWISEAI